MPPRPRVALFLLLINVTNSTFTSNTTSNTTCLSSTTAPSIDCSLNGHCNDNNTCSCNPAWEGERCDVLSFQPARRDTGYRRKIDGRNISSWGASVLYSEIDQQWHMYVSEMVDHCGIDAWQSNSHIVHAVATNPYGTFKYVDEVVPIFAANPAVVRGENGEWIMIFEHSSPPPCNFTLCQCSDGWSTDQCQAKQKAKDCDYTRARWPSYLSHASNPNGPWSTPEMIPVFHDNGNQGDFNISPIIFSNGSAIFMYRWGGECVCL